ncbi:MAG TPA: hypothetical protein VFM55_07950 [Micromonosporaceae bacterium]|nr:hypothetical protein [Micromonosporaceae bacterium]
MRDGVLVESSEKVMPPVSPDRLYLVAAAGIDPFRPAFDGLSTINVYNLNPDAVRQLSLSPGFSPEWSRSAATAR